MVRLNRRLFLFCMLALLTVSKSVFAHRPIFSDLPAADANTAIKVENPDVSQVIYRQLTDQQRQLWLAFEVNKGFDLFIEIGVPVIDRLKDYRPSMAVIGPGLQKNGFAFRCTQWNGGRCFSHRFSRVSAIFS